MISLLCDSSVDIFDGRMGSECVVVVKATVIHTKEMGVYYTDAPYW